MLFTASPALYQRPIWHGTIGPVCELVYAVHQYHESYVLTDATGERVALFGSRLLALRTAALLTADWANAIQYR